MSKHLLPLSTAIESLRKEIAAAADQAEGDGIRFLVESIDVKLTIVAETSGGGDISAGLWHVVEVGANVDHSRTTTHEVSLVLKPLTHTGADVLVRDHAEWQPSHTKDAGPN